mmetsp:Transcript_14149/g.34313  ORF Transcript_14149/g.34313 Transcript_14149/m.34313 type:complete len:208 (+) Transcript_14149:374-997(+)
MNTSPNPGNAPRPQHPLTREDPASFISTSSTTSLAVYKPEDPLLTLRPPCIRFFASTASSLVAALSPSFSVRSNEISAVNNRSSMFCPNGKALHPAIGIKCAVKECNARTAKVALNMSSRPPPTMAPGVPPSTQKSESTRRRLSKTGPVAIRSFIKSGPLAKAAMHPTEERSVKTPYLYPFPPLPERVLCSNEIILGMTFSVLRRRS